MNQGFFGSGLKASILDESREEEGGEDEENQEGQTAKEQSAAVADPFPTSHHADGDVIGGNDVPEDPGKEKPPQFPGRSSCRRHYRGCSLSGKSAGVENGGGPAHWARVCRFRLRKATGGFYQKFPAPGEEKSSEERTDLELTRLTQLDEELRGRAGEFPGSPGKFITPGGSLPGSPLVQVFQALQGQRPIEFPKGSG